MASDDDLLDALGAAVEDQTCSVSGCQSNPIAERDGKQYCGKHRDHYDHGMMGCPCERCGSKHWVKTPDATSVAVCAICEYVEYDETVLEHSW